MYSRTYVLTTAILLALGFALAEVNDSPIFFPLVKDCDWTELTFTFTSPALQSPSPSDSIGGPYNRSRSLSRSYHRPIVLNFRGGGVAGVKLDSSTNKSSSNSSSSAATEGWKNSIASGLASVCAKTLLQPFDTIKTVQQHSQRETTLTLMEAMQVVVQREGNWKDLYAGLVVSALGSIPSISLYYGIYSYCKRVLFSWMLEAKQQKKGNIGAARGSNQALRLLAVAMAAAIGNTIASFSRVPYEVVKQKLQTGQYANTVDALVSLFRHSGFRAFFPPGGIAIQMLRDVPYAIVTLLVYEYLRDVWNADQDRQVWKDMTIGAIAGGAGSFLTNGLDVLKTRLQTSPPEVYGGSIVKCARITFQEGGISAFLRGSTSRLMHKMPANGFFFYFFELFRTLLKVERSTLEQQETSNGTKLKG
ncbi:unnamed protein product [Cylindrotheca closterium]|uniref:Mitochondrial carrier protein n=1 Tax=Cylindrotheca closterium TaxID=2856 RepID=A0AAD2G426_9STRA|nr:unnamed protein product [Cylindrotheca closterium]